MPLDVGIIGCGAIGEILAEAIDSGKAGRVELKVLFDLDLSKARNLSKKLSTTPETTDEFEDLLNEELDVVVEVASQRAVRDYAQDVLQSGKELVILSSGALSREGLMEEIKRTARDTGNNVYIPSGAILGLDGVQAANIADLEKSVIKTRKPPAALSETKYVKRRGIDLTDLDEPKRIFKGPAKEAVEAFPGSINVAASLSFAGIGLEDTTVEIIADPSIDQNNHKIMVEGDAGRLTAEAYNYPSPQNPKSSYLAALSAIKTVKKLTEPIKIGT